MAFLEYELIADALYLGERPKGEIFKPCIGTIPFSQISGALNRAFGRQDFKAAGYLVPEGHYNQVRYLTYSPRDRVANLSKVPLQVEFLSEVLSRILILDNDAAKILPELFSLPLGGLRSRGFGSCRLTLKQRLSEWKPVKGTLLTRIPMSELHLFDIRNILAPKYGYLFKPEPGTFTGVYVKSLFENSLVVGPPFLLGPWKGGGYLTWITLKSCLKTSKVIERSKNFGPGGVSLKNCWKV